MVRIFIWAARLPAVAVGLSAVRRFARAAPIPAATEPRGGGGIIHSATGIRAFVTHRRRPYGLACGYHISPLRGATKENEHFSLATIQMVRENHISNHKNTIFPLFQFMNCIYENYVVLLHHQNHSLPLFLSSSLPPFLPSSLPPFLPSSHPLFIFSSFPLFLFSSFPLFLFSSYHPFILSSHPPVLRKTICVFL